MPTRINWTAVFTAFCQNHPLEEIIKAFGLNEDTLKEKIREENWEALRRHTAATPASPVTAVAPTNPFIGNGVPAVRSEANLTPELHAKFAALQQNRKVNLDQAVDLREEAGKLIKELRAGTFTVDKIAFDGSGKERRAVVVPVRPSMQDLVALATFAKMAQDMTYKALADTAVLGSGKQGGKASDDAPPAPPPLTVYLPSVITQEPRPVSQKDSGVIDIRAEVQSSLPVTPAASVPAQTSTPTETPVENLLAQTCSVCNADLAAGQLHDKDCPYFNPPTIGG